MKSIIIFIFFLLPHYLFAQEENKNENNFIFTKYVMLNDEEITTVELRKKVHPAQDLLYMYAIKETQKARKFSKKALIEGEGITLVYTLEAGSLNQILEKYGINLKKTQKDKQLKINLSYKIAQNLNIVFASSTIKKNGELAPMEFLEEGYTKIGKNKFTFEFDLEEGQSYFLWILEPMSNTNPEPGAFHFIKLKTTDNY